MRVVCLIVAFLATSGIAGAQVSRSQRPPIIDMHLHAFAALPAGTPNPFWLPRKLPTPASDDELMRASLEALERFNVVKAIASGPVEIVGRWKAAAPDRIIASPFFPPRNEDTSYFYDVGFLRSEYRAGRLGALGELVAQMAGLSSSDQFFEPYFALCEELDIPVAVHTGFPPPGAAYAGFPKTRAALGTPLLLEDALVRHPKLRVYIMHAGYPFMDDTIAFLHAHPQVYVDLAEINWIVLRNEFHEYLRRLLQAGFGKRLMFGSDQMVWPGAIALAIEGIDSAPFLTSEEKRDIFYNNAARFLRLDRARD